MGIAILVIFSLGLFQLCKALFLYFKPRVAVTTEAAETAKSTQSEVSSEPNWSSYEIPTFIRRGLPSPVLIKKVKAKRVRKPKFALNQMGEPSSLGDENLLSTSEGDNHEAH